MKKFTITLLMFLFYAINSFSQDTSYFTKGLMANAPAHYGREAIVTDILAYKLYTHTLKKPVAGESFGTDEEGQDIAWQAVVADSLNRLRPETRPSRGRGQKI